MSTMQIVFSIIGLVLIAAIVGHGIWTIRRNEKQQREQADEIAQKRHQAHNDAFDADGIGEVRVIKRAESNEHKKATATEQQQTNTASIRARTQDDDELDLPEFKVSAEESRRPSLEQASEPAQQSMDLPLERNDDEPIITEEPEEVIVLHVTGDIQGAVLLQQMTELGFKYGEFDIFHRHVDTAGNGPVLFSLANMYNPGSFDIDAIETFQTDGVALFLALPIKSNSLQAFTMMHNAAVKLAAAVERGQVLDEQRNPLTRQVVQHIHQRIREFERKRLIKHS